MATDQSNRHQKRSRTNDGNERVAASGDVRAKRQRTSESNHTQNPGPSLSNLSEDFIPQDTERQRDLAPWSFSQPVGGRYNNADPILTMDEAYLFVGLDTSVQVFATSTSRLLRTLPVETGQKVIGFRICPSDEDVLYIFTSASVTKWHWNSGKKLAIWETNRPTISIDFPLTQDTASSLSYFSIVTQKNGKRGISISTLGDKDISSLTVLQTSEHINVIKVACGGRVLFGSDGSSLFLGTTSNINMEHPESASFIWRQARLPVTATSFHLRENSFMKGSDAVDLVVGESGGSILIYHDIVNTLFGRNTENKISPRKLHWHRGPVSAVRWSKDGNYILSGGQECVMVLWQLDTGRKQFLPHLSSPVCNIVVSSTGNSYVVRLADNSIIVLSARELQPSATVIGLQLCPGIGSHKDSSQRKPSGVIAALHPQHPERLLVAVPAVHQFNQQWSQRLNSAILQTFDIRGNGHISRQALARTNNTTLAVGPEGSPILAPDVQLMDIVQDGKWLATVDTWTPHPQDVEALACDDAKGDSNTPLQSEVFLKFWKWTASSDTWTLVTRIDAPHFAENRHSAILDLVARPISHEFASLGVDSFIRFWCRTTKHRSGLKTDPSEPHLDTWKCRGTVDLSGCLDDTSTPLPSACMSFSDDGSVLAVCLPLACGGNGGQVLLIDVRKCAVHYRRTGVFFGSPCTVKFFGRYLIVASTGSIAVWDTVDDVVKPIRLFESSVVSDVGHPPFLAVNQQSKTMAIVTRDVDGDSTASHRRRRRFRYHVQIYDVPSFDVVFRETLGSCPLALLSDMYSGDYVIIDATATVQRLGCSDKASQRTLQPHEVTSQLDSGLASIFSRGQERTSVQSVVGDHSATQGKGLASVFGDIPPFSLPSIGVLFRNVVQTLGSS